MVAAVDWLPVPVLAVLFLLEVDCPLEEAPEDVPAEEVSVRLSVDSVIEDTSDSVALEPVELTASFDPQEDKSSIAARASANAL